jgi:hypothetical protein
MARKHDDDDDDDDDDDAQAAGEHMQDPLAGRADKRAQNVWLQSGLLDRHPRFKRGSAMTACVTHAAYPCLVMPNHA